MGRRLVASVVAISAFAGSCGGSERPPSQPLETLAGDTIVLAGDEGAAIWNGEDLTLLEGLDLGFDGGALAVPAFRSSVAVLSNDRLAVIADVGDIRFVDCRECSGLAAFGDSIVTSRKNFQPGEGFDIVTFDRDLHESVRQIARLIEPRVQDFPAENTASPTMLAASDDTFTVSYLSANGGARGGPDLVVQYSEEGQLIRSIELPGTVHHVAASPDGQYVALSVGGSGGACMTHASLLVIGLDPLRVIDVPTELPVEVMTATDEDPWFTVTDLVWEASTVHATGEVHVPEDDGCDSSPELWERAFDPASGSLQEGPTDGVLAQRWLGPRCDDRLVVTPRGEGSVATLEQDGQTIELGPFRQVALGKAVPEHC